MAHYDRDCSDLLDTYRTYILEKREFDKLDIIEKRKMAFDSYVIVMESRRNYYGIGQSCDSGYCKRKR